MRVALTLGHDPWGGRPYGLRIHMQCQACRHAWLAAWGILHARWRGRHLATGRALGWTLVLIGIALVAVFPPIWNLVS